jgi:hypothetical protein
LLGALTALGLDVLWLALSVLLAAASVWFVAFPLFGSITGLVVAPLAGWRYGRAAACGQPVETWVARALGFAVAIGLALWSTYLVGCIVLLGMPGGSANVAPFIAFAAFESGVYVVLGTVFVTIPIGCLWVTLLRIRGRPSAGLPRSALGRLSAMYLDVDRGLLRRPVD